MFIIKRITRITQIHLVGKIQNVSVVKQLVSIETIVLTRVHKALNIAAVTYQLLLGLFCWASVYLSTLGIHTRIPLEHKITSSYS
jgi:hypothetical protein